MSLDEFISGTTQKLAAVGAAIGLIVSVFQMVILQSYGSWREYLAAGAMSVLVGVGTFLLMADWGASEGVKVGVACASTWCAKDVLAGIKTISTLFANNPFDALERVRTALRGGEQKK